MNIQEKLLFFSACTFRRAYGQYQSILQASQGDQEKRQPPRQQRVFPEQSGRSTLFWGFRVQIELWNFQEK